MRHDAVGRDGSAAASDWESAGRCEAWEQALGQLRAQQPKVPLGMGYRLSLCPVGRAHATYLKGRYLYSDHAHLLLVPEPIIATSPDWASNRSLGRQQ